MVEVLNLVPMAYSHSTPTGNSVFLSSWWLRGSLAAFGCVLFLTSL